MSKRVLVSWSSGKDCAWMLRTLKKQEDVELVGLLTTVNAQSERVAMHSTRLAILNAQASSLGLPLQVVPLPWPCTNVQYELAMHAALEMAASQNVTHLAFGDLFLEDIRDYRCRLLQNSGIEPWFPIWQESTETLAHQLIDEGFEAYLTCVDAKKLPSSFAGRRFDRNLLNELPNDIDPCGENGEFHTCVLDGPIFKSRIHATIGAIVERDGFIYSDLIPAAEARRSIIT
jgi:uncharacterized protein (TIGR00290 family)